MGNDAVIDKIKKEAEAKKNSAPSQAEEKAEAERIAAEQAKIEQEEAERVKAELQAKADAEAERIMKQDADDEDIANRFSEGDKPTTDRAARGKAAAEHLTRIAQSYPRSTPDEHTIFGFGGLTFTLGQLRDLTGIR